MRSSIFNGRVPYDEALHRLNAEFSPKPGDLLTHEDLAKVVQEPKDSFRYRGVIQAWIRQRRRLGVILSGEGRARGIGLMCCLPNETADIGKQKLRTTGKVLKRQAAIMDITDTAKLNQQQLDEFNLTRRAVHLGAAEIAAAQKTLKPPPAVSGDNVRLLKKV
jgi:hypothetical protein